MKQQRYGQAIRLASTVGLSREEWLDIRQQGIGSSDAAVAVGLSPYKSALSLWLEKTGRKQPRTCPAKRPCCGVRSWSQYWRRSYAERTGRKVRRVNAVLQHPEFPICWPISTVGDWSAGRHRHPSKSRPPVTTRPRSGKRVPVAYQCQVLHQLAVTGLAWADVAVLIGGQDFRIYRIERDENKMADLLAREAAFWRCVTEDVQPEPDGSSDAGSALQWLYPQDNGLSVDFTDSAEFCQLFADLLKLRDIKEQTEAQESQLKQRVQNALGMPPRRCLPAAR